MSNKKIEISFESHGIKYCATYPIKTNYLNTYTHIYNKSDISQNKRDYETDYERGIILGKGGYGTVYLVKDKRENKEYAMKIIHKDVKNGIIEAESLKNVRKTFKNDKYMLRAIPEIKEAFFYEEEEEEEKEEKFIIVMEYIKGRSYNDQEQLEALTPLQNFQFTSAITEIIYNFHKHNYVHRDIKPSNIMLRYEKGKEGKIPSDYDIYNNTVIIDFGFLCDVDSFEKERKCLLTDIKGTLSTMAPELLEKRNKDWKSVDVWAMAVTIYRVYTKKHPYEISKDIPKENRAEKYRMAIASLNYSMVEIEENEIVTNILKAILVDGKEPKNRITIDQVRDMIKGKKEKPKTEAHIVIGKINTPEGLIALIKKNNEVFMWSQKNNDYICTIHPSTEPEIIKWLRTRNDKESYCRKCYLLGK